jgi:hypothetical protein
MQTVILRCYDHKGCGLISKSDSYADQIFRKTQLICKTGECITFKQLFYWVKFSGKSSNAKVPSPKKNEI